MLLARDLSANGKLVLTGPDRARFLHGLVSNDVLALVPGSGCRAAMLTIKGKLIGDLRIYCEADALWVETDPTATGKVRDELEKHLIMDDVTIEDRTAAVGELGVCGDRARAVVEELVGALPDLAPYGHTLVGETRVVAAHDL